MEVNMPFLKSPIEITLKDCSKLYRENIQNRGIKEEFNYYEYTPIEKIIIDEHNLVLSYLFHQKE